MPGLILRESKLTEALFPSPPAFQGAFPARSSRRTLGRLEADTECAGENPRPTLSKRRFAVLRRWQPEDRFPILRAFAARTVREIPESMRVLFLARYCGGLTGVPAAIATHSPSAFSTPSSTASADRPRMESAEPEARHPSGPRIVNRSNRPPFEPSDVTSLPRAEILRSAALGGCSMPNLSRICAISSTNCSLPPRRWVRNRLQPARENGASPGHASASGSIPPSGVGHRSN